MKRIKTISDYPEVSLRLMASIGTTQPTEFRKTQRKARETFWTRVMILGVLTAVLALVVRLHVLPNL